jgi:hypothetical protein
MICSLMAWVIVVGLVCGQELPPPSILPPPTVLPPGSPFPPGSDAATIMPPDFGVLPEGPLDESNSIPPGYSRPLFWFRGSYLHWWTRDDQYPALLTIGSTSDANPGALGQAGTRIIAPNLDEEHARSGARFNLGMLLDPDSMLSL